MKPIVIIITLLFIFLIFPIESFSQLEAAMFYLNFSRSAASIGLGEQGVASQSNLDALNFNPANLIYTNDIQLSYFRNPFYSYYNDFPFTSLKSFFKIPDFGYFGIEYLDWNLGNFALTSSEHPEIVKQIEVYERSFSIGYARNISDEFALGVQARYAKSKLGVPFEKFFISTGLKYAYQIFNKPIVLGFSLTNFTSAIEYVVENFSNSDPPPSDLKLGVSFTPIENHFHSIEFQFEVSKYITEREGNKGQSAFKSLYTDWQDFPEDVTVHTGLAFRWLPLTLGNGFSFFQEFYLGNISTGPKSGIANFFTHGAVIGLKYNGVSISTGYAGWWHNVVPANYYFPQKLPRETFQFNVGIDQGLIFSGTEETPFSLILENIILSTGPSYTFRLGRSKEENYNYWGMYWGIKYKNSLSYSIEGDFYIDESNALISNFSYQSVSFDVSYWYFSPLPIKSKIETFSFSSLYRYHPLETFQPLFIQGGLGIIRANPILLTYPKYDYRTYLTAGVGALVELSENIYMKPGINFTSIFSKVSGAAPRLGSYNQFDVSVKLGYQVN